MSSTVNIVKKSTSDYNSLNLINIKAKCDALVAAIHAYLVAWAQIDHVGI